MAAGFHLGAILPGPARALANSARTVRYPTRRLAGSARFVLGTFTPGGYARFGDGCKNATRLRLAHAAIRARLHRHGWDAAVYGAPLSQADTLMAALTFNVIPALAAARLGYRFNPREQDSLAHFGACAAYRQGVPSDLLTVTLDEQRAFIHLMLSTARADTDPQATRTVLRPLVTMSFPGLPAPAQPLARAILHGYGRIFFGDELCDHAGDFPTPLPSTSSPSPAPRSLSWKLPAPAVELSRRSPTPPPTTGGTRSCLAPPST